MLIHQRWAGQSTSLNGGTRWLAVSLWTVTILSAQLPHSGCKISDYQDTLSEVHSFLEKRPQGALLLGMDCNVSLAGVVDRDLIGEAVMERSGRTLSAQQKERQALLVEFMEEHSLMGDGQKAQIDFIMASQDWYLQDTWIDQYTHAATDHRHVCAVLSKRMICGSKPKFTKKPRSLQNCQPGDKWAEKAKEALEEDRLGNWRKWEEKVRGVAQDNRKDTKRRMDPLLMSLLAQYKAISSVSSQDRRFLSKQIWRRKRHLKREAIEQAIQTAAAVGRAPPGPRPSLHVRWDKLLEGKESSPEELLSDTLQRAPWCARGSQNSSSRGKSFGNRWMDQQGDRSAGEWHEWNRCHGLRRCTQEAQEREEQSRWTDSRNPAEPSPGAEINALDGGDATNAHSGVARGMVRVYGSAGTENSWSKLSGKIPTGRESEHHEEDLWIHVPLIAPSAGLQVETDGLCQRLSRKHGCTHVPENWRIVQRMELGVQRCSIGRSESFRPRLSRCCTTSDGRDGSGKSFACSDSEGLVFEQGTSEIGKQDLGTCEPGTGTPARSPGEPKSSSP